MPDLREIYERHADRYELLASREDYQGNILPALNQVRPLSGLDIVDLGTGTGRLACMLAPIAHSVRAFDVSQPMLDVAITRLQQSGLHNWEAGIADHRCLPLEDNTADVVVSGWSLVYTAIWSPDPWQQEVDRALAEIERVLRPDGTVIVLETMGTGHNTPHPPEELGPYFAYLEEKGFSSTWIRSDYQFDSLAEAQSLVSFFFGDDLAQQVTENNWIILPEYTGIWWRTQNGVCQTDKGTCTVAHDASATLAAAGLVGLCATPAVKLVPKAPQGPIHRRALDPIRSQCIISNCCTA